MKFIRYITIILAITLLLNLCMPVHATQEEESAPQESQADAIVQEELTPYPFPVELEVRAKAAMLIELNSNTLIYEYQKDLQVYPASLTKIMTCMLAIEHGDLDAVLTVSSTALQNLSEFGSTAGLLEGEQLPLHEILYCIMVSSANEGCNVIAEHVAGDIDSFVEMMNEQAQRLGMTSTHFANAHGLHDTNHYTTAYDLSLLARWAWENEQFREYATATTHVVPATNKSASRTLYSTNYLTSTYVESKYYYSRASGIKTGFTTPAGGCLISTASNGSLDFMSIVLGCSPQTADNGEFGDERFVESKKLFEYGFDNVAFVQVLSDTKMVDMPEVEYSAGRENVVVRASDNRTALLPASCGSDDIELKIQYDDPLPLEAPLKAGERVGVVTAYYNGQPVASCLAVTVAAVERSATKYAAAETGKAVSNVGSWFTRYWFLTVPLLIVLGLLIVLLLLRSINVRRAKKRAERRRRNAQRRRNNGKA